MAPGKADFITIANPGRDRDTGQLDVHPNPFHYDAGEAALRLIQEWEDPWPTLLFWESEFQARQGITNLCRRPYLTLDRSGVDGMVRWVPTRMLFPDALTTQDPEVIEAAVRYVTAAIQQAREFATAAEHVSEVSRPPLHFYAAEMLARAVAVAVLGPDILVRHSQHGLKVLRPSTREAPTLVQWQARGEFGALYRATRWDSAYGSEPTKVQWPIFHIWECLRRLELVHWPDSVQWTEHGRASGHARLMQPWDPDHPEERYLKGTEVDQKRLYDVPDVLVEFMVLYHLSVLARYHPVAWRDLLAGREADGFHLRRAGGRVFSSFVHHVADLLPTDAPPEKVFYPTHWVETPPTFDEVQHALRTIGYSTLNLSVAQEPAPPEWRSDPDLPE